MVHDHDREGENDAMKVAADSRCAGGRGRGGSGRRGSRKGEGARDKGWKELEGPWKEELEWELQMPREWEDGDRTLEWLGSY